MSDRSPYFDLAAGIARSQSAMGPLFEPQSGFITGLVQRDVDRMEGRVERDRVLTDLRERRKELVTRLNRCLVALARSRKDRIATGDDAMRLIQDWPAAAGLDPRWTGVVWRTGPWVSTGRYVPSLRRENHARPIRVWQLAEGA